MIDRRVFSLAVVVCCLFAMVSLSASLESAVETSPGEAIELEYASLPLGVGEASELKESYHSAGSAESGEAARSSQSSEQGSKSERSGGVSEAEQGSTADPSGGARDSQARASGGTGGSDRSSGAGVAESADGAGELGDDRGLLAMLRELLSTLGSWLVWLGVAVTVLFSLIQRDRLLKWVRHHLQRYRRLDTEATADAGDDRPFRPPENVVERSWLELLSRADVDPDPSATPRETAGELVDAGFDRQAVWELTELFEEIRYDDAPVTPARVSRTLDCLRRCRRTGVTAE